MHTNQYDESQDEIIEDVPEEENLPDDELPEEDGEDDSGDLPESLPEHSMEHYPEETDNKSVEPPAPKKRDKAKVRINQLIEEKYQTQYALQQAQAENERLRKLFDESTKIGAKQFEININSKLDKAKYQLQQAIEMGDPEAQANAQVEIAAATNEMQYMKNWQAQETLKEKQQEYYQQQQPQQHEQQRYQEQDPYHEHEHNVEDWVHENQWFNPNSNHFDKEKAVNIDHYSKQLNTNLIQSGNAHFIGTDAYFAEIDKQARLFDQYRQQNPTQQRSELNMRTVRGGASPTRRGVPHQPQTKKNEFILSEPQKDMARRMGVTDEQYLKEVLKIKRENAQKGGY